MCQQRVCPECGDHLIHQTKRGSRESSSAFGQFIRDTYPSTFDHMDIDSVIRAASVGILREIEHKFTGQQVKPSQQRILPLKAAITEESVKLGINKPGSGVFVVWADDPFESLLVCRVAPDPRAFVLVATELLTGKRRDAFCTGRPLNPDVGAA